MNKMKTFKIGYISDLHIDFYVKDMNPSSLEKPMKRFIDNYMLPEKMDILLIAGDEGHYEEQTKEFITQMKEFATHVCLVGGNHSMYLVSRSQKDKHHACSSNRVKNIKDWCATQDNVYYLDGDVVNVNGLKIGGYMNWYNLDTDGKIAQWNDVMNDSNLIMEGKEPTRVMYGYGAYEKTSNWDTQSFRKYQEECLNNISKEKCNILLTHIVPVIIPDEFQEIGYVNSRNNIFYMTDDLEKVKETDAEVVIYGHNHTVIEWELSDIQFKSNALGYPKEPGATKIEYFDYFL